MKLLKCIQNRLIALISFKWYYLHANRLFLLYFSPVLSPQQHLLTQPHWHWHCVDTNVVMTETCLCRAVWTRCYSWYCCCWWSDWLLLSAMTVLREIWERCVDAFSLFQYCCLRSSQSLLGMMFVLAEICDCENCVDALFQYSFVYNLCKWNSQSLLSVMSVLAEICDWELCGCFVPILFCL